MPTPVQLTAWKTRDGTTYQDRIKAVDHELRCDLDNLLKELCWGRGGDWSPSMLLNSMIENKEKFATIFKSLTEEV